MPVDEKLIGDSAAAGWRAGYDEACAGLTDGPEDVIPVPEGLMKEPFIKGFEAGHKKGRAEFETALYRAVAAAASDEDPGG